VTLQWQGKYLEVHKEGTWEYAARTGGIGAAVILAITEAREIILVEQYRVPHHARTIELPAGLIGDTGEGDTVAAAAQRELAEETGFEATQVEDLGLFATSAGMTSEVFNLVRATGLTRTGPGGGVGNEDITSHIVPLSGLPAFLAAKRRDGCVIDCRLVIGLGLF
jgi:ADP-ribose pyrophosphatase